MRRLGSVTVALVLLVLPAAIARAATDTQGKTALQQTIRGTNGPGYDTVGLGPGLGLVVRGDAGARAQPGRETRRRSLLYFGQMTDFQLADEESPSKVEFADISSTPFTAAWRPHEALMPFVIDHAVRQMNFFADASPISKAKMKLVITTGDSADNQQRNETRWVVRLLEGGTLNPNSGMNDPPAGCPAEGAAPKYTGIQDYDDYPPGNSSFYDPDDPRGPYAAWPKYAGLMDRAERAFQTPGLKVPSYVAFGNHDGLAQGNEKAVGAFEAVGTGCAKWAGGSSIGGGATVPVVPVPPDPERAYVTKHEYKELHRTGRQPDAHGFGLVDPSELSASAGAAGYYAWSPSPGFRFIAIDTVSEGGVAGPSANGNIDDPQFRWLERELQKATANDQLAVLFGHHPVRSLNAPVPDETPPPCGTPDPRDHDPQPGCDHDPRDSQPLRLGADLVALMGKYRHAIAYVAGHTHENKITAFPRTGGGWWGIETSAEADWPQRDRLLEVFDNRDGTLSIFGIPLDHMAPTAAPPAGPADGFSEEQLASIARVMTFNDPQAGGGSGEGRPEDDAVELLVRDPRRSPGGAACVDTFAPSTFVNARATRLTRRSVRASGRAVDRDCTPAAQASRAGARRVARTYVAVGRKVGGGCRFLTAKGRLSGRRDCRRQIFLRARVAANRRGPGSTWTLRRSARLPRGRYFVLTRSRDLARRLERKPKRRELVYERVR
jgi:metallophosphoesterase (TIGR03767 family)